MQIVFKDLVPVSGYIFLFPSIPAYQESSRIYFLPLVLFSGNICGKAVMMSEVEALMADITSCIKGREESTEKGREQYDDIYISVDYHIYVYDIMSSLPLWTGGSFLKECCYDYEKLTYNI